MAYSGVRVTSSTAGSPAPGLEHLSGGYRYQGIPDWTPGDERFRETEGRRPGPPPGTRNNRAARAERFARFCAAVDAGASWQDAGVVVGVSRDTARKYNAERKQRGGGNG